MEQAIQQMINGLSLGGIYALIALGYTMVYGIIGLINFAHGDIYMVGAFVGYALTTYFGLGLLPSLIISMVICSLLGMLIEKVAYKPLRNSPRISALITAISVSLFLQYTMMYFVGPQTRTFPEILKSNSIQLFDGKVVLDIKNIIIVVITVILMAALQYIINNTRMGKAMRAASYDMDAAELMGVNVDKIISFTFIIGSALAGAAGVLVGVYYNTINPLMGSLPGIKAFVAAVLGGIGAIPGAVFGGFTLGMIETIVSANGGSIFKDAVSFIILILVLLIKPNGLLGRALKEKV
ncbi:branched-chain amino acid ABC transporter permease [Tepidimicrobium xylanilyticum]|uniref:Amino acid/amide ABC transporter membrane protein 1, HAAT family (TC 3.A.1.4.-) n=1 Tax=Tepidimicrobium xylanilyticum TaxID=1123352 RepID=A0A1H2TAQ5_9FIRM|nr:branched-chain amino acid ABC transporter permease [Tepidimicrobium xylanilyticum]GMG95986.1 branched-chain amino acid ABC transporter permease [Tepidimicrobium xylanilyticum]SDW41033.1 amino acid/amide ABC transporter membrane protein 1, HAAT family (TC 3.A.1.4.-) [Tepidimicrobium xylanilyticum]